jgi:FMN phosphatase YigB (HAD superfamily)
MVEYCKPVLAAYSLPRVTHPHALLIATPMSTPNDIVFMFDCDNTLLDNDLVQADLRAELQRIAGIAVCDRYWEFLEELRTELGYVDYLGALQRYRQRVPEETRLLMVSSFLVDYPFATRLYPDALAVIRHCQSFGSTMILTDGDVVFQPRKLQRSGLWEAVAGNVLIYIHKEQMLDDLQKHYPARHYVMVDDKLRILTAMKAVLGDRLTTVFPRQGHYALEAKHVAGYPPADFTVERIGTLLQGDLVALMGTTAMNLASLKAAVEKAAQQ